MPNLHQLMIRALDTLVEVSIEGISTREYEHLAAIWNQCSVPSGHQNAANSVKLQMKLATESKGARGQYPSLAALAADLSSLVTLRAIENAPREWLLLHAAAVAHPENGLVVGFIGPSGAGKSTLAQTLAKKFCYVTDETLAVNLLTGTVLKYPKPLSIIDAELGDIKLQCSPTELGLETLPNIELKLAALFVINRLDATAAGAELGSITVNPLEIAEAIKLLLPQVSFLDRQVEPVSSLVRAVEFGGGLKRVGYREASELVELASQVFATSPAPIAPSLDSWQSVPRPAIAEDESHSVSVIRATDFREALVGRDVTIVYRDGQVFVLQGIGGDIWLLAQKAISRPDLLTALLQKRGGPATDSPEQLIRDAIEMLSTHRLVATA